MKYFIVLSALMMLTSAQRPSYASSGPIGRPGLASRFKDTTSSSSNPSSTTVAFENRVGEDTSSTPKIPVDARGDTDLVNTLNSWEREHQPFWFLNAEHIEKARNTTRTTQAPRNPTQNTQINPMQNTQMNPMQNTQINNRNRLDEENNRNQFAGQDNQGGMVFDNQNTFGSDSRSDFIVGQSNFATNQAGSFHPESEYNRRPSGYPFPNGFEQGRFAGNPRGAHKFRHNKYSFFKF